MRTSVIGAWSLPSCCFLRQETLLHIVSFHPGVPATKRWSNPSGEGGGGGGEERVVTVTVKKSKKVTGGAGMAQW